MADRFGGFLPAKRPLFGGGEDLEPAQVAQVRDKIDRVCELSCATDEVEGPERPRRHQVSEPAHQCGQPNAEWLRLLATPAQ